MKSDRSFSLVIAVLTVFAVSARGAHDIWAATICYVASFLILAWFLLHSAWHERPVKISFLLFLLIIVGAFGLSYRAAGQPYESWLELMDWLAVFALVLVGWQIWGEDNNVAPFIYGGAIAVMIQGPVCIYRYFVPPGIVEKWGTLINANFMVAFLILWTPVLIEQWRSTKKKFWLVSLFSGAVAFATAQSTWGWICLLMVLPLYFGKDVLAGLYRRKPQLIKIILTLTVVLIAGLLYDKFTRVYEWSYAIPPRDSTSRLLWWSSGLKMFAAHPWTGIGVGNFPSAYLAFKVGDGQSTLYPHSVLVGLLAETGILGTTAVLLCGVYLVWCLLRDQATLRTRWPYIVGLMGCGLFSLISLSVEIFSNLFCCWLFIAIATAPLLQKTILLRKSVALCLAAALVAMIPQTIAPFRASQLRVAGELLVEQGDLDSAIIAATRAELLNPHDPGAPRMAARAHIGRYMALGDAAEKQAALAAQDRAIANDRWSKRLRRERELLATATAVGEVTEQR
jgi:hypothetical protein